jgi:hypothetical protein
VLRLFTKFNTSREDLKAKSDSKGRIGGNKQVPKNIENPNNPKHLFHVTIDPTTGEIRVLTSLPNFLNSLGPTCSVETLA